eukprot:13853257-Ditylum_brightwellii.AAC.2
MSGATRSMRTITGSSIKDLVGLDATQLTKLANDYNITTLQDLALLNKAVEYIIFGNGSSTFLVRRKLFMLAEFLKKGGNMTSATTINDIVTWREILPAPVCGVIEDQENFKTKAEVQIGQTAFKFLLSRDVVNTEDKERDEELFNIFKHSFHGGKSYNVITQSSKGVSGNALLPSGQHVWKNFKQWCNSGGQKNTLIKNTKEELKGLKLDGDYIDGFNYVNNHIVLYNKLDQLGAKTTDVEQMTMFVENIVDPDFEIVMQLLENYLLEIDQKERSLNQKEFTDMFESWLCGLNQLAGAGMEAKSRRAHFQGKNDSQKKDTQKRAFLQWKNCTANGELVPNEEIQKILKQENSDQQGCSGHQKKKQKRKIRATTIWCIGTQTNGSNPEEVRLLMKSDNKSSDSDSLASSGNS